MQTLRRMVLGMVALVGTSALASLPVVSTAQVARGGCAYSIKVLQDVDPNPYPQTFYRITVESSALTPECTVQPRSVELGTSKLQPQIAIQKRSSPAGTGSRAGWPQASSGAWSLLIYSSGGLRLLELAVEFQAASGDSLKGHQDGSFLDLEPTEHVGISP